MENIIFSFQVVLPLLIYMALGFLADHIIQEPSLPRILNKLVFTIIFPINIFLSTLKTDVDLGKLSGQFLFVSLTTLVLFLIFCLFYHCQDLPGDQKSVLIQASYRSNYPLLALPLGVALLSEEQVGQVTLLIPVVIPLFNLLSILVLSYYGSEQPSFKGLFLEIVKNPLILALLAGFFGRFMGLKLPQLIETPLYTIGTMASPLALVGLGASFSFTASKTYISQLSQAVFFRLLFAPGLALLLATLVGFRGASLVSLLAVFASPVAISSYPMAEAMHQDSDLAGQILVYTTLFSTLSLFLIILILRSCALV